MDIIFLGSHGYNVNYGGWETFVKNLIDNWDDPTTRFFVFGLADKKENQGIKQIGNIYCINIFTKAKGGLKTIVADWKSFKMIKRIMKEYNIKNPILYVMGARIGFYMWLKKKYLVKHNIHLVHNPAGLEWKRDKWNFFTKKYIYYSHVFLAKASEKLICDSKGMVEVYDKILKKKKECVYIPYGTYPVDISNLIKTEKISSIMDKNSIVEENYFLMIGRFVPENNYEIIIREFLKTDTNKDLVIVCNNNQESKFYKKLENKLHFSTDKRIKFIGPIYDKEIVNYLRYNAFAYIHGHSVGGTNPGLLEALSVCNTMLVYDVNFNRYIAENTAIYFDDESTKLSDVINSVLSLSKEDRLNYGKLSRELMAKKYKWEFIVEEYKKIFNNILDKK